MCWTIFYLLYLELLIAIICVDGGNASVTCSESHSYNLDLTSVPSGLRQIINSQYCLMHQYKPASCLICEI